MLHSEVMSEGAPMFEQPHSEPDNEVAPAPRITPEQVADRIIKLANALDEAIDELHNSAESADQTSLERQAEAANELAGSIQQEYEAQSERFGEVTGREEYKALQTLAALNEMAQSLAGAYGAAADAELSADRGRTEVTRAIQLVMEKLSAIGDSEGQQSA